MRSVSPLSLTLVLSAAAVAAATGTALTAPYRWQHSKQKGGIGGSIPQRHHQVLLDFAKAKGVTLEAKDFLAPVKSEAA